MKSQICKGCGAKFVQKNTSKAKYCSQRCRSVAHASPNFHNYKSGWHISKSGSREHYDSSLEEQAMFVADAKGLNWTKNHGLRIPYFNPSLGRSAIYIPDMLIRTLNQCRVIEIKPYSLCNTPVNQAKFRAAKKFCEERGYIFEIICSPGQIG